MPKKCFTLSHVLRLLALTPIAIIFVERPLQAYADPGSGLLLWQVFGAVILGVIYQMRRLVRKLRSFAISKPVEPPPTSTNSKSTQSQRRTDGGLFIS